MASKSTGKDDVLRDFEEWRKNKPATENPVKGDRGGKTPAVSEDTQYEQSGEQKISAFTVFFTSLLAWVKRAGSAIAALGKSAFLRTAALFAGKEKRAEASEASSKSLAETAIEEDKSGMGEKKHSIWTKIGSFLGQLRARLTGATPRGKKLMVGSVIVGALVVIALIFFAKFEFVTVDAGIDTSAGEAKGATVLIEKNATVMPNDLVVTIFPGGIEGDDQALLIGTVFSFNEETYALYDGEVIWQVPLGDLKGKVVFASATQLLP